MRTLVVVPAYNEADIISVTLEGIISNVKADVLVVDDGSADATFQRASSKGVEVVRHVINLGLGASLETGLEYARRRGYDMVVTFDADGQHDPRDIPKLLGGLGESDLVIGVRSKDFESMPYVKRLGNACLNALTWFFFGVYCSDSQSGLRAFNRRAVESLRISAKRYEVSSEILYEARALGLRISEVGVRTIYTDYSMGRGTGVSDGFKILWRMILHRR